MITHDMTEAILLADRIAVMRGGKLLAQGTPTDLSGSSDAYVLELLRTPRRRIASTLLLPSYSPVSLRVAFVSSRLRGHGFGI